MHAISAGDFPIEKMSSILIKSEKKIPITERVFQKKKSTAEHCIDSYIFLRFGFFPKNALGDSTKIHGEHFALSDNIFGHLTWHAERVFVRRSGHVK